MMDEFKDSGLVETADAPPADLSHAPIGDSGRLAIQGVSSDDDLLRDEGFSDEEISELNEVIKGVEQPDPPDLRTNKEMPWLDAQTSQEKGARFEHWANQNLMNGEMERLVISKEQNAAVDLEAGKRRISDDYWVRDNAIWDMKAGYQNSPIDKAQLHDYYKMLRAGEVAAVKDGVAEIQKVESVNYLFDTKEGALHNHDLIADQGSENIYIWYLDGNNEPKPLDTSADFR